MEELTLKIKRSAGKKNWIETYQLKADVKNSTVLEGLQKIQADIDPTLAIRYGCRFKHCGLCAVTVNDVPRMACFTKLKDNMVIGPLNNIPVLQDLVVDRSFITKTIKEKNVTPALERETILIKKDDKYEIVSKCTDCQACVSGSTTYKNDLKEEAAAPLFFVKLAQLQFHPQNNHDYRAKAIELGVEKYKDSPPIPCPYGIPIKKIAIDSFLESELEMN